MSLTTNDGPTDNHDSRRSTKSDVPVYSRDVAPLLDRYCLHCHDSATAREVSSWMFSRDGPPDTGTPLAPAPRRRQPAVENMPPEGEPRPTERARDHQFLARHGALAINRGCGRVDVRRLNRAEYNNTIRDLIGLDLHPADRVSVRRHRLRVRQHRRRAVDASGAARDVPGRRRESDR